MVVGGNVVDNDGNESTYNDMPEQERQRGRDAELQKRIAALRIEIEEMSMDSPEQLRKVYIVINQLLSILNSEQGTQMRILDRQDEIIEHQDKVNKLLFGNGDPKNESLLDSVKSTNKLVNLGAKVFVAVLIALAVTIAKSWYEGTKTNEIIAGQKDAATKALKVP